MKKVSLSGKWRLVGNGYDCEGSIPGSLYSILLENSLIDDPFYRDNEAKTYELALHDYEFIREFEQQEFSGRAYLRFEGLDTFCDVYLNGEHIAYTDDMHITYEFDVTDKLVIGKNELRVVCHECDTYVHRKSEELELFENDIRMTLGFAYVRKAHCMLGWDWGPRLPDMGIWREPSIVIEDSSRIEEVRITQRHADGEVFITPQVTVKGDAAPRVLLTAPDGSVEELCANEENKVENPLLWWPRGLGEQPLYTVTAELVENGEVVDRQENRIGLRTLKLIREKDRYGESFTHECNGVRFFAMGGDYIPEDNIFSRITPERSRRLLELCVFANFNAVRIWGGGYYLDNWFFEMCDELGLIVFMDLAFACTLYNPDEKMMRNIEVEVRQNLMRLRHHPSIAVISGNNEVESCGNGNREEVKKKCIPIAIELFEGIIPDIVRDVCPEIPYISSSPTTVGHFIDPNNENYGDSHYWRVWHSGLPFTEYRNHYFRYLSEFGFQSFPCEKTVEQFTLPEDRNIFSRVMELHQRNHGANSKIVGYLSQTYLYPNSFSALIYASQLLQAEAIKYCVEHLRRNRGRCMGALYWQLNDIWPVASWSSIDYYSRLKALHYYAKRFYAPMLISCNETGETTTRPFVIMEPFYYDYETKAELAVTNDTTEDMVGTVYGYLRNNRGEILEKYSWDVTVPALSALTLEEVDFKQTDVRRNYYSYELSVEGETVSAGTVLFTAPKHFTFLDPKLTVMCEGGEITVSAQAYAKSVEIYSPDCDLILSDNFFDMNAGKRTVKIIEGDPKELCVRSVYDIK